MQSQFKEYTFASLMWEFLMENKILLVAYIIVLILIPLNEIGIPHLIGKLMESLRSNSLPFQIIYTLIAFICLIQVGNMISDYIEMRTFPMFQRFLCNKILDYILTMNNVNLQEIHPGKILSIMAHAPRTLFNYLDVWRIVVIPQLLVFIISLVYMYRCHWKLAIVLLAVIVVFYVSCWVTLTNCMHFAQTREEYLIAVNEHVDDVLANTIGILNAGTKSQELGVVNMYYHKYREQGENALRCTYKYKGILTPICLASIIVFIIIGFDLVRSGKLKVETFVSLVIIYLYTFNSIIRTINDIKDAAFRGGMIAEHLKIFSSMKDPNISNTVIRVDEFKDKYIYFDDVTFAYKNTVILQDFSLEMKEKEKILIPAKGPD